MDFVEQALELFHTGNSCAQSVLTVFASQLGLAEKLALKIAYPFGGGMGVQNNYCGAVTGALMVIGLKWGRVNPENEQAKIKTHDLIDMFLTRFQGKYHSLVCHELIGCDINLPEGHEVAQTNAIFDEKCPRFVADTIKILEDIL